jgi:hypothetical protein
LWKLKIGHHKRPHNRDPDDRRRIGSCANSRANDRIRVSLPKFKLRTSCELCINTNAPTQEQTLDYVSPSNIIILSTMASLALTTAHSMRLAHPVSRALPALTTRLHRSVDTRRTFLTVIEQGREGWRLRSVWVQHDIENCMAHLFDVALEEIQLVCHRACI